MTIASANRATDLVRDIEKAFADVQLDGGTTLHEAEAIDRGLPQEKQAKARRLDSANRWTDVPPKDIETHPEALSFLDTKGYRFYLPAYMVWSLCNYKTSSSLSSDYTIYSLAPDNKPKDNAWKLERFRAFTSAQGRVIYRFLEFMAQHTEGHADDHAAKQAMEGYWKQFST